MRSPTLTNGAAQPRRRRLPAQKPGASRQDYATPPEFIDAVERRFGPLVGDLAASADNAKHPSFFTEAQDSLSQPWARWRTDGVLWLNPPFGSIAPWAEKCAIESSQRHGFIVMLTPAAVGTRWFADHVRGKAFVLALEQRITFVGETTPIIKDLMLCVYGHGLHGFDTWAWRGARGA